ncbi:MAG: hypothetical protein AAFP19_01335 [Bacteroidota bacterium]
MSHKYPTDKKQCTLLPLLFLFLALSGLPVHAQTAISQAFNGQGACFDKHLIDLEAVVPTVYDPVCGCDGLTYPNEYIAQYRHGISRWEYGPCRQCDLELDLGDLEFSCDGAAVCLSIRGGQPPYTILLNSELQETNDGLEICFRDLQAGSYRVSIYDAQQCEAHLPIEVPHGDQLVEAEVKDLTCFEEADGAIDLFIPVDIPLLFYWTGPNGFMATTQNIKDLEAGIYQVRIYTLEEMCFASLAFEVEQPRKLTTEFYRTVATCRDGVSACLITQGGTMPYKFWVFTSPDANTTIPAPLVHDDGTVELPELEMNDAFSIEQGEVTTDQERCATGIPAGFYYVLTVDANWCWDWLRVEVPAVEGGVTLYAEAYDATCFGGDDGAIEYWMEGGQAPYEIYWEKEDGLTGANFIDLSAGTYKVKVIDANACMDSKVVTIGQPEKLEAAFEVTREDCTDGVDGCLYVYGGTMPYQVGVFTCPNPINTDIEPVFTASGDMEVPGMIATDVMPFEPTSTNTDYKRCANGIPAGVYYVFVVDANRCWTFTQVTIPELGGLHLEGGTQAVTCFGGEDGAIELGIAGGQPPYFIYWEEESGMTGERLEDLPAGTYTVKVYDAHQCSASQVFTIREPEPLEAQFEITSESCEDGVDGCLYVYGGTMPYQLWVFTCPDTTNTDFAPTFNPNGVAEVPGMTATDAVLFEPDPTTGEFKRCANAIPVGVYYVLVADANRCWTFLRVEIPEVDGLQISGAALAVTCFGGEDGAIDLQIEGGQAPYEIFWTNAAGEMGERLFDLPASTYQVQVMDAKGCKTTASFTIRQPAPLEAEFILTQATCDEGANGCLLIQGGSEPYRLWVFTAPNPLPIPPTPVFTASTASADGLHLSNDWNTDPATIVLPGEEICAHNIPAGLYYVLIADANNCWIFKHIEIEAPQALDLYLDFDPQGAFACVDPINGLAPYHIEWFDFNTGEVLAEGEQYCVEALPAGIYSVKVKDARGCETTEIFIIEPSPCTGGIAQVDPAQIQSGEYSVFSLHDYEGTQIQWQFKTEFTEWLDIPGATSDTYITPAINVYEDKEIAVRAQVLCEDGTSLFSTSALLYVIGHPNATPKPLTANDRALFDGDKTSMDATDLVDVFPTISRGQVSIRLQADAPMAQITVSDLNGQRKERLQLQGLSQGDVHALDLGALSPGLYLLETETLGIRTVHRVIIQ